MSKGFKVRVEGQREGPDVAVRLELKEFHLIGPCPVTSGERMNVARLVHVKALYYKGMHNISTVRGSYRASGHVPQGPNRP